MAGATQIARIGQMVEAGGLEPSSVNQVDNSLTIIQDLRCLPKASMRFMQGETSLGSVHEFRSCCEGRMRFGVRRCCAAFPQRLR